MSKPVALRRAEMLEKWDFSAIPPFSDVPPKDNPKLLSRLFTGRAKELERAILTLLDGNNLLVRGVWGVGKTAFILHTLHEFSAQAALIRQKTLPIYIDNFRGGALSDFYRPVLFALSMALADKDKDAASIADAVRGIYLTHTKSKTVKGQAEINLLTMGKLGGEIGLDSNAEKKLSVENPEYWVEELIARARKRYDYVIIAIDDLDKTDPNPTEFVKVREMFDGALSLLRNKGCAFILAGRTLTVAQDIYARILGIFREQILLPKLQPEELNEIAVKTMNLVRRKSTDNTYPLQAEAMNQLIMKSGGNPRQFNRNCADVLATAIRLGIEIINQKTFQICFEEVQANVGANIDGHVRQLLYIAHKYGGFSQDNRKALQELNRDDFIEVLPLLEELVEKDLMYREEGMSGPRFLVSPRAETAASLLKRRR